MKAHFSMSRWHDLYEANRKLSDKFWALSDEYHSTGENDKSLVYSMNAIYNEMQRNWSEMDLCRKINHKG